MLHNKIKAKIEGMTLNKLSRYAADIPSLVKEFEDEITDFYGENTKEEEKQRYRDLLHQDLTLYVTQACERIATLSKHTLAPLTPHQLKVILPALDVEERTFVYYRHDAKQIYDGFKALTDGANSLHELAQQVKLTRQKPRLNAEVIGQPEPEQTPPALKSPYALLPNTFILNIDTALPVFIRLMKHQIDPNNDTFPNLHHAFNAMRLSKSFEDVHEHFFGQPQNGKPPFVLKSGVQPEELLKRLFKETDSPNAHLSQQQLWRLSKRLTPQQNTELFGKASFKRNEDIPISDTLWDDICNLEGENVRFTFEEYQHQRMVLNYTLGQSLALDDMKLRKVEGAGQQTVEAGSKFIIAWGMQGSKLFTVLSQIAASLPAFSVAVQQFVVMPFLGALGLIYAKINYDEEVDFEAAHRLNAELAYTQINQITSEIDQANERLKGNIAHFKKQLPDFNHYQWLRQQVIQQGWALPQHIIDLEQKHQQDLQKVERKLLFYLTQWLMTYESMDTRKDLEHYITSVKTQLPQFKPLKCRKDAISPFFVNAKAPHIEHVVMDIKMYWADFKDWCGRGINHITPYVAPTITGGAVTFLLGFIVYMTVTNPAAMAALFTAALLVGILSGAVRYTSDRKKEQIIRNAQNANNKLVKTRDELKCVRHHQKLCDIIEAHVVNNQQPVLLY